MSLRLKEVQEKMATHCLPIECRKCHYRTVLKPGRYVLPECPACAKRGKYGESPVVSAMTEAVAGATWAQRPDKGQSHEIRIWREGMKSVGPFLRAGVAVVYHEQRVAKGRGKG
jgi:hypothetical protein